MTSWARWVGAAVLAGVIGLAGCASTPPVPNELVLKERQGRFAVQTSGAFQEPQAVQGGFVWRRLASGWQLDLNSPLGATLARLTVSPTGASLERPDAPDRRAASASALLAEVVGAPVPVDALEDWIDGRIKDDSRVTSLKRDELGRVVSFAQGVWRVRFAQYGQAGPGRIDINGNRQGQNIKLRLVVDQPV